MEGLEELNAVLTEFDNPAAQTETKEEAPEEPEETTEETTEETPEEKETTEEKPEEEDPEEIFKGNKQNKAFAEMRVQNKKLNSIVQDLGRIMGVPDNTAPEELINMASARLTELKAQAEKVPVELYKELEESRRLQAETEQETVRQQATLAFQKVKDEFQLSQQDLTAFARQLNEAGKNPFNTPMDLVQEYRSLNWERILEAERKKVEKEYQDRLKKAKTKSTAPSKATGGSPETTTKVSSMKDFENLLGEMN